LVQERGTASPGRTTPKTGDFGSLRKNEGKATGQGAVAELEISGSAKKKVSCSWGENGKRGNSHVPG